MACPEDCQCSLPARRIFAVVSARDYSVFEVARACGYNLQDTITAVYELMNTHSDSLLMALPGLCGKPIAVDQGVSIWSSNPYTTVQWWLEDGGKSQLTLHGLVKECPEQVRIKTWS